MGLNDGWMRGIVGLMFVVCIGLSLSCGSGGGGGGGDSGSSTYSISGQVTNGGSGFSGVTVILSGNVSDTDITDSSGNYSFSGLSDGAYTITPYFSGYTFNPTSRDVTISGANQTGINFSANYSTSDFEGTWYGHELNSGDAPQWNGWIYMTSVMDSSGNFTESYVTSSGGSGLSSGGPISISSDGVITVPNGHGIMNLNKNIMVGVDNESGNYTLWIDVKGGGTFTASDLQGTWNYHELVSGDSPQWIGWVYGTATVDNNGNLTFTSIRRSDGNLTLPNPDIISISTSGIVSGVNRSSVHGIMSQDKNTIIGTGNDDGGGYGLITFQKSGGTFTTNDLAGTWNYHGVSTGDSPQWNGWIYGRVEIDSSGNSTTASFIESDGDISTNPPPQLSITTNGIVTMFGEPDVHGVMSSDKQTIVMTGDNEPEGGYILGIWQK